MPHPQLILCRYLLPIRPRETVLEHHGVLIENGIIADILPQRQARSRYPQAETLELPGHVLMPGLVNAHGHAPMCLMRGYADDLPMQVWLREHIWPAESQLVDRAFVRDGTQLAIAEMVRAGTTSCSEFYFFPDEIAKTVRQTGIRSVIGIPLLDQETPWAHDFDDYLEKGMQVAEDFADHSLISFSLAPHAPYSVSDAGFEQIREVSETTGMRVHLHLLETDFDNQHSIATYGETALERLERLELLNHRLISVHMTQLDLNDCSRVAESGAQVVHCPQSNMKLASGVCPVVDLMEAGANVCLGTDGAASNNNLDLLEEARFASLLAKGVSGDATVVNAMQTLEMMTINGALALGLDDLIGSIEVGKQADLCAMNLSAVNTVPFNNVISQVAYSAASSQFTDVWVRGEQLMKHGKLLTINEDELIMKAEYWQKRMENIGEPGVSA